MATTAIVAMAYAVETRCRLGVASIQSPSLLITEQYAG
ncbi:hypothetical protein SynRS9902_02887 [Synechococcus sp. RS9902]|nr:hypothetical protein SynRS9902_02887 [Synechococcus sp. RS9902]